MGKLERMTLTQNKMKKWLEQKKTDRIKATGKEKDK